jgi:hypothetical protein
MKFLRRKAIGLSVLALLLGLPGCPALKGPSAPPAMVTGTYTLDSRVGIDLRVDVDLGSSGPSGGQESTEGSFQEGVVWIEFVGMDEPDPAPSEPSVGTVALVDGKLPAPIQRPYGQMDVQTQRGLAVFARVSWKFESGDIKAYHYRKVLPLEVVFEIDETGPVPRPLPYEYKAPMDRID